MLFQIGSNWGGDRKQPLVEARADSEKLEMLSSLLHESGWTNFTVAYAHHEEDKRIEYSEQHERMKSKNANGTWPFLDQFTGVCYLRPLFYCTRDNNACSHRSRSFLRRAVFQKKRKTAIRLEVE